MKELVFEGKNHLQLNARCNSRLKICENSGNISLVHDRGYVWVDDSVEIHNMPICVKTIYISY